MAKGGFDFGCGDAQMMKLGLLFCFAGKGIQRKTGLAIPLRGEEVHEMGKGQDLNNDGGEVICS